MALLWEALATREVKLLAHSHAHALRLPAGCAWVNYLRSHDDIGWTFDDDDALAGRHRTGFGHRQFLNSFYTGRFAGSFARGVPFQENPAHRRRARLAARWHRWPGWSRRCKRGDAAGSSWRCGAS